MRQQKLTASHEAVQLQTYELQSKLLVSRLICPIVVHHIIPYIAPFKEFRLSSEALPTTRGSFKGFVGFM